MAYVITAGTGGKPVNQTEVASNKSKNPRLIVGAKPRTKEEEKKFDEDKKKAEAAWEEKRKKMLAKKSEIKNSGKEISDSDAEKIARSDDLEKENAALKSKLTSAEGEKRAELQGQEKTIKELEAANETLKTEALKQGGTNDGKSKPPKKK